MDLGFAGIAHSANDVLPRSDEFSICAIQHDHGVLERAAVGRYQHGIARQLNEVVCAGGGHLVSVNGFLAGAMDLLTFIIHQVELDRALGDDPFRRPAGAREIRRHAFAPQVHLRMRDAYSAQEQSRVRPETILERGNLRELIRGRRRAGWSGSRPAFAGLLLRKRSRSRGCGAELFGGEAQGSIAAREQFILPQIYQHDIALALA